MLWSFDFSKNVAFYKKKKQKLKKKLSSSLPQIGRLYEVQFIKKGLFIKFTL